ncbi:hypothetical protein A6R68_03029, partial [Neotoma lepida]
KQEEASISAVAVEAKAGAEVEQTSGVVAAREAVVPFETEANYSAWTQMPPSAEGPAAPAEYSDNSFFPICNDSGEDRLQMMAMDVSSLRTQNCFLGCEPKADKDGHFKVDNDGNEYQLPLRMPKMHKSQASIEKLTCSRTKVKRHSLRTKRPSSSEHNKENQCQLVSQLSPCDKND